MARHRLGHEAAGPVQTHHIGDLLLALLAAGPGQCREGIFARDFALGGEAVLGGLGSPLYAARVTLLEDGQLGLPTQLRQVPPAGRVRCGRQPPSWFVSHCDGSHHLGHQRPGAVRPSPPPPVLPTGTAPAPGRAIRVLGAVTALGQSGFFLPLLYQFQVVQKRGQTALPWACFPPALPTCSPEHPCSQSSILPVPMLLRATKRQALQEQPLCTNDTTPPPLPLKTPQHLPAWSYAPLTGTAPYMPAREMPICRPHHHSTPDAQRRSWSLPFAGLTGQGWLYLHQSLATLRGPAWAGAPPDNGDTHRAAPSGSGYFTRRQMDQLLPAMITL